MERGERRKLAAEEMVAAGKHMFEGVKSLLSAGATMVKSAVPTPDRPLVALKVDEEFWPSVLSGDKTITIRNGRRDYRPGDKLVIFPTVTEKVVETQVQSVRHCRLDGVSAEEMAADGFGDVDDMIDGMKRFYPDIEYSSVVTVITWEGPEIIVMMGD